MIFELIIFLLNPVKLKLYHIISLSVKKKLYMYLNLTPQFEYMVILKRRVLFDNFCKLSDKLRKNMMNIQKKVVE